MKRIKILLSASLLLMASVSFGQTEKTISSMKEGTKLTDADIGFLSMVSNAEVAANRGAGPHTATIGKASYSAGKVLTKADATAISAAVKSFQKTYKAPDASRGAGLCWYWYYWCDGWGYCYWYKYWYYC
jgi:hypothetical protein